MDELGVHARLRPHSRPCRAAARKLHDEFRARRLLLFRPYSPFVSLQDLIRDREPQTLAARISGVKRLEVTRRFARVEPYAGVADADAHPFVIRAKDDLQYS